MIGVTRTNINRYIIIDRCCHSPVLYILFYVVVFFYK
uniref:Uncharacterized protein n=1 Tax=Anguilla anguilla TaxID=7936 RepID=A0A0E9SZW1_ANGAN